MDITKTQFAKLVLGYLKIEKCHIAYNTFLSTSPYLKDYVNPTKRKHLITRILGLSLHDILEEFSKIYTIIQEHLEDTNYFNESNQSHLLHKQLIYLLEVDVQTHQGRRQSSSSVEIIPNASEDELVNCPPPKKQIAESEGGKSDLDKTEDSEDNETHLSIQAITDTLLKHPEFQEKIAENINKVRLSDGALDTPEKLQSDIDSAIKAVLEKTQNDPMFETLMGEIIGTAADEEMVFNNEIPPPPTEMPVPPLTPLVRPVFQQQQQFQAETIDDHIKVAVDSIVTASQQQVIIGSSQCADSNSSSSMTKTVTDKRLTMNTNNDIIFYDGTIDNYMQQQQLQQQNVIPSPQVPPPPPLVLNNLVMMTSTPTHQVTPVDASKSYFLVSGPSQPYYVSNKVLTEKDLLSMPTVILNDVEPKPPPPIKKKSEDALTEYLSFNNSKVQPKAIIHVEVVQDAQEPNDVCDKQQQQPPTNTSEQEAEAKLPTSDNTKKTPESNGRGGASGKRSGVSTPRSTNKSHVRALDFKFQTPSKDVVEVRKSSPKVSTAKSLFSNKSKSPKKKRAEVKKCGGTVKSWDADLRATVPDTCSYNTKKKKKPPPQRSKPAKSNLNKTEEDAKQIENNLHLEEKLMEQESEKKNGSSVELQEQLQQEKNDEESAVVAVKETCEDEQQQLQVDEEKQQQPRGTRSRKQQQKSAHGKANVTVQIIESENQVHEIALRNFNAKPRFHRKCNIENNTKFKHIPDKEMAVPVVVIAAAADVVPPPSPSALADVDSNSLPVLSIPDTSSFATPEALKSLTEARQPVSASRNIVPILETPSKDRICPKTPGRSPMINVETPFTKVFNEQMEGIDISSIRTPQLTPFPITPFIHGDTPYSNRPTDYSTSSSYYQPSDTEQNKSLEMQIIEECRRNETKKKPFHEVDKPRQVVAAPSEELDVKHKVIADKMKSMSSNVIGRKNISMIPKVRKTPTDEDEDYEEDDEDDSDDSSSCDGDSSSCSSSSSGETYVNRTIVEAKDETRYSLRSTRQQVLTSNDEIKSIISQVNVKEELTSNAPITVSEISPQRLLMRDLEEKRRRTIAKFKNENTPSADTRHRNQQAKTSTEVTTPVLQNSTPRRVLRSTKAQKKKEEVVVVVEDVEPMQLVETEMLCSNSSDCCEENNVPVESKKMLMHMKEMGFPLVPNKFLKGVGVDSSKNEQQPPHPADVPPKQTVRCSPDLNNSNEENRINAQNVQKPCNNSNKKASYLELFGPDEDSKDDEIRKNKTKTTTADDSGKEQQRRRTIVTKKPVKKKTNDEPKSERTTTTTQQTDQKGAAAKRSETMNSKSTKPGSKDLKTVKSKRNTKTTKPSDCSPKTGRNVVDKPSESNVDDSLLKKESEESTRKVKDKSQREGSKTHKSEKVTKRKNEEIKITIESAESGDVNKKTKVVAEEVDKVKDDVPAVKAHAHAVQCLKKSEEDKVKDKTKVSEVEKRIETTNQQQQQRLSKTTVEEKEDSTILKGVVCNGGVKEGIKVEKPKIIDDDATTMMSKSVDSKTKDVDVVQQQPPVDEYDLIAGSRTLDFSYVDSDPPNLPEVQVPLDNDRGVTLEVFTDEGSHDIILKKITVQDFWHIDPKLPLPSSSSNSTRKRKRNVVEVLGDVSVMPVKMQAAAAATKNLEETTIAAEEPPKKKFLKQHKIEDVVDDMKRLKSEEELLKEVDVDNFLDKLHGP